jgi:GATA-binding protein
MMRGGMLIWVPTDRSSRLAVPNAPSGIAQLRKSSEFTINSPDAMNIDDFIFSENAATPAGIASPLNPAQLNGATPSPAAANTNGIPIKSRKDQQPAQSQFVPQSVPEPPQRVNGEFNYVNRHLRKTSIDERPVCRFFSPSPVILFSLAPVAF